MKTIETEEAFHKWLMRYMRKTAPFRTYPKPLVDFAEYLVEHAPQDLNSEHIWEYSGWAALGTVFENLDCDQQRVECSPLLVRYAGVLFNEASNEEISIESANRLAVRAFALGTRYRGGGDYFKTTNGDGGRMLKSTKKFEREFHLKVSLFEWEEHDY